jgi:aminoglycoside 6'-N-acetyltransferase
MNVSLRPMSEADLPLVAGWLRLPQVARWWTRDTTAEAETAKYRDRVRRGDQAATHMLIISADGTPIGWCQWYLWADYPAAADALGASGGEAGIDYAIGDPACTGRGVGTTLIAALVAEVRRHHPGAGVLVDPDAANTASRRVLEKNGFLLVAVRSVVTEPSEAPRAIYRLPARPAGIAGIVSEIQAAPAPEGRLNWWPRVIEQVLQPLALNQAARYQRYDWDREKLAEWHVLSPAAYLVLAGVSASR